MIWVAWRQFRTQALVTLCLLTAFAVLVLMTGAHLHHVYDALGGSHCGSQGDCQSLSGQDKALADLLGPALLAIPALIGMFWGAPLLAREIESGTYRLAWTQSITRRRWLSVRIALIGGAALAVAGLASWLVSWWFAPLDAVNMNRFDPSAFTARGIVAIGYAGFAFALGVALGGLIRRTLPAMAATLLGFVAARIAFTLWARPHLLPAKEALAPVTEGKGIGFFGSPSGLTAFASPLPIPNAWVISARLVDRGHHALGAAQLHALVLHACPTLGAHGTKGLSEEAFVSCQHALSPRLLQLITYQPPSHFWPLQAFETGLFLLAALALIGLSVWRIGRHMAPKPALHQEEPTMIQSRRPPVLTTALATAALSLLVAGCGSSSPSSNASDDHTPTQTQQTQIQRDAVRFAQCMRAHGVNVPDPTSPGSFKGTLKLLSGSPAFNSGMAACQQFLPRVNAEAHESAAQHQAHIAAMLAFARCMRSHGFQSFPDPSGGQITHEMLASAGIDIHQPAAAQAADACVGVTHGALTAADVARFIAGD